MNKSRKILILYSENEALATVNQLANSITNLRSIAIVRKMCRGQYDGILEAVQIADTVIYWPADHNFSSGNTN